MLNSKESTRLKILFNVEKSLPGLSNREEKERGIKNTKVFHYVRLFSKSCNFEIE